LFSNLRIFIGSAALISLIILYFVKFKTNKNYLLGILIIFAAFVPEMFFSKFYFNNYFGFSFGFPLLIIIGLLISISSIVKDSFFENKNNSVVVVLIFLILSITNFIYSKNFSSSKLFYESQYQSNPENVDFLNSLVELEIKSGQIIEAENLLNSTDIESSKLSKSLILMGDYYYSNKNYALAIPFLEKATSNNEKNINALNLLANCYFNNKQFDKAENILLPLSKQTDKYPNAKWDLLNIYLEIKDFDKADSLLIKNFNFVNEKPKLLELINSWSKIYFQEKDNVAVVKSMKLGLFVDPDNAVILNYLYDTYTKIGLKDKAAIYEKRLLKIFNEQESGKIK
jgi:tetratricopeptide (TPR) repeat protein